MRLLKPDACFSRALDLDPDDLCARGVRAVLLDLDNTLLARGADVVGEDARRWVGALRRAGIAVGIISNSRKPRVRRTADALGVALVEHAFKPFTWGYHALCGKLGVPEHDAVMVGDQSYTDILGAHLAGLRAVLVRPLSSADPPHTRVLRAVDAWAVRGMAEGWAATSGDDADRPKGT